MITMRAAVLEQQNQPLAIRDDVEIRDPGPGQVRVKVSSCGICHSDLSVIDGAFPSPTPIVLGHEAAGVVESVGANVRGVEPGDHVVLTPCPPCGRCYWCVRNEHSHCELSMGLLTHAFPDGSTGLSRGGQTLLRGLNVGGFAEYALHSETGVVRVPKDAPLDVVCVIGCAVQTGVGAVLNTARVVPGASVLVVGCGGVGLSAILGARLVAATPIIAVDLVDEKRALALQLGATHALDPANGDIREQVRALTEGRGVRYAFEAIGRSDTIEAAYESLEHGGTMTVVGQVPDGVRISLDPYAMSDFEFTLTGSNYGSANPAVDFPRLLAWYASGQLDLDPLVARRIALGDINEAFAELATGRATRSVIVYDA